MFRGMWQDSERTRKLVAAGKWEEAGEEYKKSSDYRNAISNGLPGIITRTDAVVKALKDEAKYNVTDTKENKLDQ